MRNAIFAVVAACTLSNIACADAANIVSPSAWVSGLGKDAPACGSTTAPCRTFEYAYGVVVPGGSIFVKDAADYSAQAPLVITHAISIINKSSGTATIVAHSGDGIDVEAGASDNVYIEGLTIDGAGGGDAGINIVSAASVTIEHCLIKSFDAPGNNGGQGDGILVEPQSGTLAFTVTDTVISGNAYIGVFVVPGLVNSGATATVSGTLTRVAVVSNQQGVVLNDFANSGALTVIATEVDASGNSGDGFYVNSGSSSASLYLNRATATGNLKYGVENLGKLYTYKDNSINNNVKDLSAPLTAAALQ